MRFNTRLPVRFLVQRRGGLRMYELCIVQRANGGAIGLGRPFSLASRQVLEVGAHYLAQAGDSRFFGLRKASEPPQCLAAAPQALCALVRTGDLASELLGALLAASTQAEYELLKGLAEQLLRENIVLPSTLDGAPCVVELQPGRAVCEHYFLGRLELGSAGFAAEFACVNERFESMLNE